MVATPCHAEANKPATLGGKPYAKRVRDLFDLLHDVKQAMRFWREALREMRA